MPIGVPGSDLEMFSTLLHSSSMSSNAVFRLPILFPTQELNLTQFVNGKLVSDLHIFNIL